MHTIEYYQKCVASYEELDEYMPLAKKCSLADCLHNLSCALGEEKRFNEAILFCEQACSILEGCNAENDNVLCDDLIRCYMNRIYVLNNLSRANETEMYYDKIYALQTKLRKSGTEGE